MVVIIVPEDRLGKKKDIIVLLSSLSRIYTSLINIIITCNLIFYSAIQMLRCICFIPFYFYLIFQYAYYWALWEKWLIFKENISIYLVMVLHTSSHIIILALLIFFVGNVTKILPQVMTYSLCFIKYTI